MFDERLLGANILIIDDALENIVVLEVILRQNGFSSLRRVLDSRQALQAFQEFQPDLVLLDLHMPFMDGFAVMEQLKEVIPAQSFVPIVVLTADWTPGTRERALSGGAVDFLTKPLNPTEVRLRVRNLLQTRLLHRQLESQNEWLEEQVRVRTEELQAANRALEEAYDNTLEGWAALLDLRDRSTTGHSRRVTEMTVRLAERMGFGPQELVHIRRGALLHDIGKMAVPDAILLKPGPLNPEEERVMRQHPEYAHQMLSGIPFLKEALDIPYCHHEHWDGQGYPQGLVGEEIPLPARLFAIVDVWDALRSDRPYRVAWPEERVRAHLRDAAGKHFDPEIVAVFLDLLES